MSRSSATAARLALIVDDDEDESGLLSRLLQLPGFRVITATHGRDALGWLDGAIVLPSIILLDLDMPVMDGRRFLVHRAQREWRDVPVIVVSGGADLDERVAGFAVAVHRKPVQSSRLIVQIELALRTREPTSMPAGDGGAATAAGPLPDAGAAASAALATMAIDAGAAPTEPPPEASSPEPPDPTSIPAPKSSA